MLTKKMEDICNRQIEREGYSSNLYLAMASWAETSGLAGIAQWLYSQAEEERMHMLKFFKFLNERGGKAIVPEFRKPDSEYASVEELFNEVLKHEQYITSSINEIVDLAIELKDHATNSFLKWFVDEQLEEEASVQAVLDKLKILGKHNLYMFDRDIMKLRSAD
ncbi:MAG: ferritin [Bacteroidales bacterium]|jgi:ferritin|nr:ferritin [Bacteroidales bacterium]